jgi:hypothetical protein
MSGTIVRTSKTLGYDTSSRRNSVEILFTWTGDAADGTVPVLLVDDLVGWWVTKIVTKPGLVAPTEAYSVTLVDIDGCDMADNALLNQSATLPLTVILNTQIGFSGFTLTIVDQLVHSATGTIRIFLKK